MCGIIGQINQSNPIDEQLFISMRDTLRHRGPDDAGFFLAKNKLVALGHRRLSFLDLSEAGRQPMTNEDGTLWLTFNGEIYNYLELKSQLVGLGHLFKSTSDSEVIIHGYEQWGVQVLQKLKGMFAFGIWDEKNRKLFLARDRFGIKPLYYYQDTESFIFASEIKGIIENPEVKTDLDYSSLCDYLIYRYVPSPKCIWKDLKKLPPAHYLQMNFDGQVEVTEYWKLSFADNIIPEKEAIEAVNNMLLDSVKTHVRSDVPIGSFLSGGYDSSALVQYLNMINYSAETFSIGFEGWDQSEHQYAEIVSKLYGTKHTSTLVDGGSLDVVEKLMHYYDEPIADISIIPTFLVSQAASKHVKAVFSGEGADELFCGYTWHLQEDSSDRELTTWQKMRALLGAKKTNYSTSQYAMAMSMGKYDENNLGDLLSDDLRQFIPDNANWFYDQHYRTDIEDVKRFQLLDIKTFMGELVLTKIDRASMANSLEVRVPFLDHELYEYLFQLNQKVYFKPAVTKFLLHENIVNALPAKILDRKKQGFVGPDTYYMNIDYYAQILRDGKLLKDHIIKKNKLEELILEKDHWRLWKLMVLEFWFQKWV